MTVLSPVEIHIGKEVIQVIERRGSFLVDHAGDTIDYLGKPVGWGWGGACGGQCSLGKPVS